MSSEGLGSVAQPAPAPAAGVSPAIRAQLLATEHWSLLATRGLTWSEVMSRISIHLTVASAALVVLALVVQASGYGTAFRVLSIGLASAVLVLGTVTGVRVMNASLDDAALLIGMNRLRAAYLELDPTLADYLVTSWHDDQAGVLQTYTMGQPRTTFSHVVGSTSMFMHIVNTIVAGTLGALIASAAGGGAAVVTVVGCATGLAYLAVTLESGRRSFRHQVIESRFPSTPVA
jgi:hypothetical protein